MKNHEQKYNDLDFIFGQVGESGKDDVGSTAKSRFETSPDLDFILSKQTSPDNSNFDLDDILADAASAHEAASFAFEQTPVISSEDEADTIENKALESANKPAQNDPDIKIDSAEKEEPSTVSELNFEPTDTGSHRFTQEPASAPEEISNPLESESPKDDVEPVTNYFAPISVPGGEISDFNTEELETDKQHLQDPPESFLTRIKNSLNAYVGSPVNYGIDIGRSNIRAVSIQHSATNLVLENIFSLEFNEDDLRDNEDESENVRFQKAADLLMRHISKTDWLVGSISGLEVIYRVLELPKMGKSDLADAVQWAVRKDLPYDIDSAAIDYHFIETVKRGKDERIRVAGIITQQALVDRALKLYRYMGVLPAKITAIPVAIWSLISRVKTAPSECIFVMHLGGSSSHLIFINEGTMNFHREVPTAGNDMLEAVSNSFIYTKDSDNLSHTKALEYLNKYGVDESVAQMESSSVFPLDEINANLRPVLERLVNEMRRSVDYYRSKYKIGFIHRVYLSGGCAQIRSLDKYLSAALEMDVQILNPFELIGIKKWERFKELKTEAPKYSISVGLAVDKLRGLNLLPEELKGAHLVRKAKKFLRYSSVLIILVLMMATAYVVLKNSHFRTEIQRLRDQYQQMAPVRQQYLALKTKIDQLNGKISAYQLSGSIKSTATNHLKAVSHMMSNGISLSSIVVEPYFVKSEGETVTEVDSGIEKITLSGVAFPESAMEGVNLANFLLRVEKSGYFQSVQIANRNMRDDGTIEFVLECFY